MIDFDRWSTLWLVGRDRALGVPIEDHATPSRYYRTLLGLLAALRLSPDAPSECLSPTYGKHEALEWAWYESGAIEYRVWPSTLEALGRTSLDIDAEHLHLPFPCFSISVPRGQLREDHPRAPSVSGIIVYESQERSPRAGPCDSSRRPIHDGVVAGRRTLLVAAKFDDDVWTVQHFQQGLASGQTVERCFEEAAASTEQQENVDPEFRGRLNGPEPIFDSRGYWPSRSMSERLVRIAVGVAAFGTGAIRERQRPEDTLRLVEEVRQPRHERRRIERGEEPPSRAFDVGRVLDLPRREGGLATEQSSDAECEACGHASEVHGRGRCTLLGCGCERWTGRHLRFAHLRSGHLRWQRVGPREGPNDYRLTWIVPTVVRPDLPLSPSERAYSVREPRDPVYADPNLEGGES